MNSAISAVIILNLMEWYDYSVFVYFGKKIAEEFFPVLSVSTSAIALTTVLISFVVRPMGGLLISWLADTISTRLALKLSVICMTLPTFLVGLLPSYKTIGMASAILLILLRILQGLGAGAQYSNSLVVVSDLSSTYRGLKVSLNFVSATIGFIAVTLLCFIIHHIIPTAIWNIWGWRILFWATSINIIIIPLLLLNYLKSINHGAQKPDVNVFIYAKKVWQTILKGIILAGTGGAIYFTVFVALYQYQQHDLNYFSTSQGMLINTGNLIVLCLMTPLFAYFSDLFGRKPFLLLSTLLFMLCSLPIMYMMHTSAKGFILANLLFSLLSAIYIGPISVVYTELFKKYRYILTTLIYNIGTGFIGAATLSIISILTLHLHHIPSWRVLGVYLTIFGLIGSITLFLSSPT
ncbi:MAG: MFS transporter [Pseudomonadota bacterium]